MANPITFADLDQLLVGLGFVGSRPAPTHLLYTHPADDNALFMFPPRQPSDPADPSHLASVRHLLIHRGLINEDEFDRWLCRIRFGGEHHELAGATADGDRASVNRSTGTAARGPLPRR